MAPRSSTATPERQRSSLRSERAGRRAGNAAAAAGQPQAAARCSPRKRTRSAPAAADAAPPEAAPQSPPALEVEAPARVERVSPPPRASPQSMQRPLEPTAIGVAGGALNLDDLPGQRRLRRIAHLDSDSDISSEEAERLLAPKKTTGAAQKQRVLPASKKAAAGGAAVGGGQVASPRAAGGGMLLPQDVEEEEGEQEVEAPNDGEDAEDAEDGEQEEGDDDDDDDDDGSAFMNANLTNFGKATEGNKQLNKKNADRALVRSRSCVKFPYQVIDCNLDEAGRDRALQLTFESEFGVCGKHVFWVPRRWQGRYGVSNCVRYWSCPFHKECLCPMRLREVRQENGLLTLERGMQGHVDHTIAAPGRRQKKKASLWHLPY